MTQALPKLVTFEEFANWKPDNGHYELHKGVIVEISQPLGDHEEIIAFLVEKFILEYTRLNLPYGIPKTALVKPPESETGYSPDILLLNRPNLAVEVVSTNWRDDYLDTGDYEEIGIPEYWIVDYLGLGGRRFIGNPKQPTVSIYQLVEGEYQVSLFRKGDIIASPTFPQLNLTVQEIFEAGLQS